MKIHQFIHVRLIQFSAGSSKGLGDVINHDWCSKAWVPLPGDQIHGSVGGGADGDQARSLVLSTLSQRIHLGMVIFSMHNTFFLT